MDRTALISLPDGVGAGRLRKYPPTLAELQAIGLSLRKRSLSDALGTPIDERAIQREPDRQLLGLLDDPFETVDGTYDKLAETEQYLRERDDRRSVFLTVYTRMTDEVRAGIESGTFEDPDWSRRYLVAFANRYRRALVGFEHGEIATVPLAWRIGFTASVSDYTLLVQDALLGINAHINYDLTYTLRDVSIDPDRLSKRADHRAINGVLARLVDTVQRALVDVYAARGYDRLDRLLGSFDEEFTLVGLTESRALAWRNAVLLTDFESSVVRRLVEWRVNAVSAGGAYFVLAPSADRSLLWALRTIEGDDPPIASLSDAFRRRVDDSTR